MRQLLTVLAFEYRTFTHSAAFIGMTVFLMLMGVLAPSVPTAIALSGSGGLSALFGGGQDERFAFHDASGTLTAQQCAEAVGMPTVPYDSAEAVRQAVTAGECKYGAAIHADLSYTHYLPAMNLSAFNRQEKLVGLLRDAYRASRFAAWGIPAADTLAALAYTPPGETVTVAGDSAELYTENMVYAYALIFILYFTLMFCGSSVLTSVVREKSTKTMELLILACPSGQLINGKVFGVTLAGLTQNALLALAALVSMGVNGYILRDAALGAGVGFVVSLQPGILGLMLVFFLLGFLQYAYIYAALASTVSRMEDANAVVGLPTYLIMLGFFGAIFGLFSPGATVVTVLSYIPFFTPMIMFMRLCLGVAKGWEAVLSIALQIGWVAVIAWLSAKIYRMGTLLYGTKPRLRTLVAAFK